MKELKRERLAYYDTNHGRRIKIGRFDTSDFPNNLKLIEIASGKDIITPSRDTMLEIGCGSGKMLAHLQNRGCNVAGLDISSIALKYVNSQNLNSKLTQADGIALPFPEDTFDAILSFDSLEHVESAAKLFKEVARTLKPNGAFIFRTPNKLFDTLWELLNGKPLVDQRLFHPQVQSYNNLKKLSQISGLNLNLYKLPIVDGTMKNKFKKRLGISPSIVNLIPWEKIPLPVYPVFSGIAIKT